MIIEAVIESLSPSEEFCNVSLATVLGRRPDDAKEHIATDAEAAIEADRRADLWETKQDALVARVTRHSQGKI